MAVKKSARIASIIKKNISEYLTFELSDSQLGFVTVTDVEVTNDLSYAKVFVTFLNEKQDKEKSLETLTKYKGKIRSYVASNLDTKKCPEFIFLIDNSLETGNRIEAIIEELKAK